MFSLRRTGFDMVSSPVWHSTLSAQRSRARWRRAQGGSPLQQSEEKPAANFRINPSTHDTCDSYYGPNTSRLVMQEQRAIYDAFGYVCRVPRAPMHAHDLTHLSHPFTLHIQALPPSTHPATRHGAKHPATSGYLRRFSAAARAAPLQISHPSAPLPISRLTTVGQGTLA